MNEWWRDQDEDERWIQQLFEDEERQFKEFEQVNKHKDSWRKENGHDEVCSNRK